MKKDIQIEEILSSELVYAVFQPIISLKNGKIIGYEGLSRGPENTNLHSPLALIESAKKSNKLWDLETLLRKVVINSASDLGMQESLFLNVEPDV